MVMNKKLQIKTARMLLQKNYNIDSDTIDLESEIDSTLTFSENWTKIEEKYANPVLREVCPL